jgi:branched-chain amino acid transport system permease protein
MLFHWTTSAEPLLMIVIGGAGSFFGPLLGAGVVVFVQDYLRDVTKHVNLLYGIVVLVIALGAPGGLSGIARSAVFGGPKAVLDRIKRRRKPETPSDQSHDEVAPADWEPTRADTKVDTTR